MKTGVRYQILPSLVLGFHGTDKTTAERVLAGKAELDHSTNDYDWLGHGTYFWEYSPSRAWQFAQEKKRRGEIAVPAVVGAVIAPGVCFNLLESSALTELKNAYELLCMSEGDLPKNEGGEDLYRRHLDCAVIEMAHKLRDLSGSTLFGGVAGIKPLQSYDTVRGAFWEGDSLYESAGFKEKNHVQLCVRNPGCIKGYFRVLPD